MFKFLWSTTLLIITLSIFSDVVLRIISSNQYDYGSGYTEMRDMHFHGGGDVYLYLTGAEAAFFDINQIVLELFALFLVALFPLYLVFTFKK